jgi:hypothetical protein
MLYVVYSDPDHIRIGFDHWSKGGPLTPLIPIDYARAHRVEIAMGSLLPPGKDPGFAATAPEKVAALKQTLRVKLDGNTVIGLSTAFYASTASQISLGENLIHGSACDPAFTGSIISHAHEWPLRAVR